jgi:hypothetical protein
VPPRTLRIPADTTEGKFAIVDGVIIMREEVAPAQKEEKAGDTAV